MTSVNFNQFYEHCQFIGTTYDEKFINSTGIIIMINQLELIIKNIDDAYKLATSEEYKSYLVSMKGLAQRELKLKNELKDKLDNFINNGLKDDMTSYVLSKNLKLIPVVKNMLVINPQIDFGVRSMRAIDNYIDNKDKIINDYLEEQKEKELEGIEVDEDIEEDDETINERRKLVLLFEHPDSYIDDDGDYNYCKSCINGNIDCSYSLCYGCYRDDGCCDQGCLAIIKPSFSFNELTSVVRSFAFRYKTKKHLNDLNKVEPYDYQKMKQSRQILHNELKALYKVFQRRMITIPVAVMVKLV